MSASRSNVFFWTRKGAIGPEGIAFRWHDIGRGGVDVDVGAIGASCLMRVDISIAVKSNAPR